MMPFHRNKKIMAKWVSGKWKFDAWNEKLFAHRRLNKNGMEKAKESVESVVDGAPRHLCRYAPPGNHIDEDINKKNRFFP